MILLHHNTINFYIISLIFRYIHIFTDSLSPGVDEKQWDAFVAMVNSLLEEHPIAHADTILALRLGASIYSHYDTWLNQAINMIKPFPVKVAYLLNYWKQRKNHTTMRAMILDLDESLKAEGSFNILRQQIKEHFLQY